MRSVAEHADRAGVGQRARRARRARRRGTRRRAAAPRRSRTGASGPTSSGWQAREVVDRARAAPRARPAPSAFVVELLDVARGGPARARAASSPIRAQVLVRERDRSRRRCPARSRRRPRSTSRQHRLDLVHPAVRVVARRARRARAARSRSSSARPVAAASPASRSARSSPSARQPVAALALERRRAVREHLARRAPRACASTSSSVGLAQRARRGADPAAGARDLLVGHARDLQLVLALAPAGERQVRVAVDEARGSRAQPLRVDLRPSASPDRPRSRRSSRRRSAATPGSSAQLARRGRGAGTARPSLGGAQDLRRAVDR